MNCKQVKKYLRYSYSPTSDWQQSELEAHAQFCESCGRELAIGKLMDTLVLSYGNSDSDDSPWDEVRLANRIKSRIQEMGERGTGSWETGIIAVRGWLVAFGAAAVLLLVLSNQLTTNHSLDQTDRDQVSLSSPLPNEEIISSNFSSTGVFIEEPEHAQ